jgi:RHS repeat-associated protein
LATNASGGIEWQARYKPFGETRWTSGALTTNRRFNGMKEESALGGIYDFNARFYDPAIGRFLSADSIVPRPNDPQSLNRYAFVRNNPLKYVDPSGHCYGEFAGTEGCPSDDSEDLGPPATAEDIHNALDVLGIAPGIGEAADAVNAVAYAIEGDWGNAAISAVAVVPVVGDAAKIGRIGGKVASKVVKNADEVVHGAGSVATHLNKNSASGHFGVYEIKVGSDLNKIGKADMGRVTKSSGLPTRLHQQVRQLQKTNPNKQVVGQVVDDLGITTTAQAKKAETARLQKYFDQTKKIPPGNKKTFKPQQME